MLPSRYTDQSESPYNYNIQYRKGREINLTWEDGEVGPFSNLFVKCSFFFCKNETVVHKNERAIRVAIF